MNLRSTPGHMKIKSNDGLALEEAQGTRKQNTVEI